MIECSVLTKDGYKTEYAYLISEFDYNLLKAKTRGKSKKISLPATFDIETSKFCKDIYNDKYEAFMYHFQVCIEGYVIFGRTWQELKELLYKLKAHYDLSDKKRLIIYVHNLSYEFQFMYRFFEFSKVFATDNHDILTCVYDCFEFRCSYRLSNMSLEKFIINTPNTYHLKSKDDLDYNIIRTPSTVLNVKENGYCYNDVKGLYEALLTLLETDTIDSLPLTSTGFVRRDCRNAMRRNKKNRDKFLKTRLDLEQYELLKDVFRGGNTASNRYMTNMILKDLKSYDISSSYPFVMMSKLFPVGKFMNASIESYEELIEYNEQYCTIGRYVFTNLRVKKGVPIPYIPLSKLLNYSGKPNVYNGRILQCQRAIIGLTNIDFDIINNQYDYDDLQVFSFNFARKGYLPKELTDTIMEYFTLKTRLKGVKGMEYEYTKAKNKLNSIYGMCVTDILHREIDFDEGIFNEMPLNKEKLLDDFYKNRNNFLSYQFGVFVTAYARYQLQIAINKIGMDVVYVDTDSVKFINNHDHVFDEINEDIRAHCKKYKIPYSIKFKKELFEMGTYELDGVYQEFKTLGAKKYCYKDKKGITVTVAGLSKTKGSKELESGNGLKDFEIGKVFYDSGRTTAQYNNDELHYITINDEKILNGSNVAIVDTTYTLGISDTMLSILNNLK